MEPAVEHGEVVEEPGAVGRRQEDPPDAASLRVVDADPFQRQGRGGNDAAKAHGAEDVLDRDAPAQHAAATTSWESPRK